MALELKSCMLYWASQVPHHIFSNYVILCDKQESFKPHLKDKGTEAQGGANLAEDLEDYKHQGWN